MFPSILKGLDSGTGLSRTATSTMQSSVRITVAAPHLGFTLDNYPCTERTGLGAARADFVATKPKGPAAPAESMTPIPPTRREGDPGAGSSRRTTTTSTPPLRKFPTLQSNDPSGQCHEGNGHRFDPVRLPENRGAARRHTAGSHLAQVPGRRYRPESTPARQSIGPRDKSGEQRGVSRPGEPSQPSANEKRDHRTREATVGAVGRTDQRPRTRSRATMREDRLAPVPESRTRPISSNSACKDASPATQAKGVIEAISEWRTHRGLTLQTAPIVAAANIATAQAKPIERSNRNRAEQPSDPDPGKASSVRVFPGRPIMPLHRTVGRSIPRHRPSVLREASESRKCCPSNCCGAAPVS